MSDVNGYSKSDIAVVGMAGRFPGAPDVRAFWRNLREGVECISSFTTEQSIAAGVDARLVEDPNWIRACGILEDAELFDAEFFGYSPAEAESIDPQQRVFLECCWHALEDAGCDPAECDNLAAGVFAGCSMSTYYFQLWRNPEFISRTGYFQVLIGNDKDYLSTRTSYKLNLKGPSVGVQTACSTSLVAVCMARDALLRHQCDLALAGGVSIRVPQTAGYYHQPGGIYSPDGHCRAFDAAAAGTVFGHGAGVVVLKRLEDAFHAGDRIRAVIRSGAVNNDGSSKAGFTAPSVRGQAEVIAMALALPNIDPETMAYVEAHGTGTVLGDPIEIEALTQVFRASTSKRGFCRIGSVKTNIGHLDAAAGIASFIKTILALEHRLIPPTLHFQTPNPRIAFEETPFIVNSKLTAWEAGRHPRRAGVSSFGIGGTNAHVILEEAPTVIPSAAERRRSILIFSAKSRSAVDSLADDMQRRLTVDGAIPSIPDLEYTLQTGRKAHAHRMMAVCGDQDDALAALRNLRRRVAGSAPGKPRQIVFLFSGQGAQYAGMAAELYEDEPGFRAIVDQCAELLRPELGYDIRDLLLARGGVSKEAVARITQTAAAQPALFVVEYAIARMLGHWGVSPNALIGHSLGEYIAACLAGVFPLHTALHLVAARGRLMQAVAPGAMVAVALPEAETEQFALGRVSLACVNEPGQTVVSGCYEDVEKLEHRLTSAGIPFKRLRTSHAFHSPMMDTVLEPFAETLRNASFGPVSIPLVSNVTGNWILSETAASPSYWTAQLRRTVRFSDGLKCILAALPDCALVEIGPGPTLASLARRHAPGAPVVGTLHSEPERAQNSGALLETIGRLWINGATVDWEALHEGERRRKVDAPLYPFARRRYWVDAAAASAPAPSSAKDPDISEWFYAPVWTESGPPDQAQALPGSNWLVFRDGHGLGDLLIQDLERRGMRAVAVSIGDRFHQSGIHEYHLDPAQADHYDRLAQSLRAQGRLPAYILHLWTLPGRSLNGDQALLDPQERGFYSLINLARSLGSESVPVPVRLIFVTTGLHSITGKERLQPENATALGPCLVIPQEYEAFSCASVDIELRDASADRELAWQQILAEAQSAISSPVVGYRSARRWIRDFEPIRSGSACGTAAPIRERGVYLITGGLGGIGLALAKYLAETARAKLVLIGRSALPPREQWTSWLDASDPADPTAVRIRAVGEIEGLGSEVLALSADVSDEPEMRKAVSEARQRFGPIHGVIHAAGVPGGSLIHLHTRETARQVTGAKIQGAMVLEALFAGKGLDFVMLCSSMTAILGGAGQAHYAAGNAYLDAFAAAHQDQTLGRCMSVGWDIWQETGMAVNTPVPRDLESHRQAALQKGIRSSDGVKAFARAVMLDHAQIQISTTDFRPLLGASAAPISGGGIGSDATSTVHLHPRPDISRPFVAPRTGTELGLASIWRELLGLAEVGANDNFFTELGGHSLLAMQVVSRLRKKFGIEIPLQQVFESPTIAEFAERIDRTVSAHAADPGEGAAAIAERASASMYFD